MSHPEPTPAAPIPPISTGDPAPRRRLVPLGLAAGVLAGLVAWAAGEATLQAFRPPMVRVMVFGTEQLQASFGDIMIADSRNATIAYGELGAAIGLTMALAGAIAARRTAVSLASSAALGTVLGAALGVAGAAAALPFYFHAKDVAAEELSRDMVLPLLVHAGAWAAAGLAGGLALGIGLGMKTREGRSVAGRAAVGGVIGSVVGTVLYGLVGGLLFETAKTDEPVSRTWATRLLARVVVATLIGLMAAALAEGKPKNKKTPGTVAG